MDPGIGWGRPGWILRIGSVGDGSQEGGAWHGARGSGAPAMNPEDGGVGVDLEDRARPGCLARAERGRLGWIPRRWGVRLGWTSRIGGAWDGSQDGGRLGVDPEDRERLGGIARAGRGAGDGSPRWDGHRGHLDGSQDLGASGVDPNTGWGVWRWILRIESVWDGSHGLGGGAEDGSPRRDLG